MWVRFLLFLLLFGVVEYRLIKDNYDPHLLKAAQELKKANVIMLLQDESIRELIDISQRQQDILYNYEIIIKKYQQELYYRDTLNKRALYDPN